MQNQEVVQHNTTTTLQMWELWRSACCECIILAPSCRCSLCFTFTGKKPHSHFFLSTCIPQWMDGRGWAWTKAQLQVIAAHYQKAALIQNSGDWWKKALKGANLIGWCCCCVGDTCGRSCCCRDSSRRSTVHHWDFVLRGRKREGGWGREGSGSKWTGRWSVMVTMATVAMCVCRRYRLLFLLMVVAADVTESQQAIVRVTPADGMQPFTMQSKKDRKKEKSMGERNNKKRREADYNHK